MNNFHSNPNLEIKEERILLGGPSSKDEFKCSVFMRVFNSGGRAEIITKNKAIILYKEQQIDLEYREDLTLLAPLGNTQAIFGDDFYLELNIIETVSRIERNNSVVPFYPIKLEPDNSLDVTATLHFSLDPPHKVKYSVNPIGENMLDGYYPLTIKLLFKGISEKRALASPEIYCMSIY